MPHSDNSTAPQLRLRIFAGPNGSGKSTIVKELRNTMVNCKPADFGYYINADDITEALKMSRFSFSDFDTKIDTKKLLEFPEGSGLLDEKFFRLEFQKCHTAYQNTIHFSIPESAEKMGQIIARFR